ncbi:DUF167 family protein [Methanobacterium alcaliphilum]|uniref:DUF167 family protein n=1 Tax=Methanobacterium alcaliphilum TaxID=392018 RepID=UPI00200ADDA2|nr:DUF167 family protein [Methanobacterium alcaliphilum]MCK9152013.1 DUF167 family protein [Methanobacterium alcaliphilum]
MKAVTETKDGILVNIDVTPNASKFAISGYNSWRERIEIRITALPQKGKANKEIIKEISKLTGKEVELVSGQKSHQKTLKIYDILQVEFLEVINSFL